MIERLQSTAQKGRGAASNVTGRFEPYQTVACDDGWEQQSEAKRRTEWLPDSARRVITRNTSPDIPFDRSINPYRGCEHGCVYCYARPSHTYLGHSAGLDFESRLYAKKEAAALLRRELQRPGYQCAPIALGVNTDAYQPLERQLKITREILEVMVETRHPVMLITKSALIERDIDLLQDLASENLVTASVSLTSLDPELSRKLEPRAASPKRRLRTLRTLSEAGIPTRLSLAPVIPGLNENVLEAIVREAAEAGATSANYLLLRLPLELQALFSEWLQEHYPLRANRILNAISDCRGHYTNGEGTGRQLNDSRFGHRMRGKGPRAALIHQRFHHACRKHGLSADESHMALNTRSFVAPNDSQQLALI